MNSRHETLLFRMARILYDHIFYLCPFGKSVIRTSILDVILNTGSWRLKYSPSSTLQARPGKRTGESQVCCSSTAGSKRPASSWKLFLRGFWNDQRISALGLATTNTRFSSVASIQPPAPHPEVSCSKILLFPKEQDNSPTPLLDLRFSNISLTPVWADKIPGFFNLLLAEIKLLSTFLSKLQSCKIPPKYLSSAAMLLHAINTKLICAMCGLMLGNAEGCAS